LRGYAQAGVPEAIRAAGGEIYAVSSEPQALSSRAQEQWGFGFESVGDPHQEIADLCRDRGWLDLFVNPRLEFLRMSTKGTAFDPQHPKGYFQPGVLALSRAGRVLYRWRGTPNRSNIGGAVARPTAEHVWEKVQRSMQAAEGTGDAPLDADPPLDQRGVPWPLFVLLLSANGWFVWPRGFGQRPGGPTPQRRVLNAAFRLVGFAAAWALAFAVLPTPLVGVAFLATAAWITRGILFVNREFQNEG